MGSREIMDALAQGGRSVGDLVERIGKGRVVVLDVRPGRGATAPGHGARTGQVAEP
ncbi:MAG: hypothetical protein ACYC2Z_05325 [Candidatus Nanopelagicales bacterium]